ncbi:hypothetical protein A3I18_00440 [Candidatus Campbellbacteria bacterium RIFCSPLOWO2_02_FULL_35_11]|uniref:Uncharacterized protein n=2 Tax=Candidatus Campbelliibacteriota TaxID=1752727 RepID=A0A1F5EL97_9BACT|nr:MAG: hypothetical protein A3E89_02470 [Candidatus Campbellbacteria bacterium RIFCSPHIGHO2_12_FULL_35_10]OGD70509.1 MAG: hypothetical protein A3I18_00440 [Candidatus Campbellbacteria bacterium RIFCSPLOWO2_02_FULL_35_11]
MKGIQFEEEKYNSIRDSQSSGSDFITRILLKTGLFNNAEKARKTAIFFVLLVVIFSIFLFVNSFSRGGYEETTENSDYYVPAE